MKIQRISILDDFLFIDYELFLVYLVFWLYISCSLFLSFGINIFYNFYASNFYGFFYLMLLFDWTSYRGIQELTYVFMSLVETRRWIKYLIGIIFRDRIILVKPHYFLTINVDCLCWYVQGIGYQASNFEFATMWELW